MAKSVQSVPTGRIATGLPVRSSSRPFRKSDLDSCWLGESAQEIRQAAFVHRSFSDVNHGLIQEALRIGDDHSVEVQKYKSGQQARALVSIDEGLILEFSTKTNLRRANGRRQRIRVTNSSSSAKSHE